MKMPTRYARPAPTAPTVRSTPWQPLRLTTLATLATLAALLQLSPLTAHAADLQQYGRAWLAEGDSQAAVQSYGELVRQNPFDPVALNNMAVAKAAVGDYQTALEMLTRATKLAPQRLDIRDNLNQLQSWLQQNHSINLASKLPAARTGSASAATIWPEPPPLWPAPAGHATPATPAAPAATPAKPFSAKPVLPARTP
jgi:tetratricopeptide (TPR) repeat protein